VVIGSKGGALARAGEGGGGAKRGRGGGGGGVEGVGVGGGGVGGCGWGGCLIVFLFFFFIFFVFSLFFFLFLVAVCGWDVRLFFSRALSFVLSRSSVVGPAGFVLGVWFLFFFCLSLVRYFAVLPLRRIRVIG